MKYYKLEITIEEGSDEFWDEINKSGKSGCDEVLECVVDALEGGGWRSGHGCEVRLKAFSQD